MWPFKKRKLAAGRPCSPPPPPERDIGNDTKTLEAVHDEYRRAAYTLMSEVGIKAAKIKERALKVAGKCVKKAEK